MSASSCDLGHPDLCVAATAIHRAGASRSAGGLVVIGKSAIVAPTAVRLTHSPDRTGREQETMGIKDIGRLLGDRRGTQPSDRRHLRHLVAIGTGLDGEDLGIDRTDRRRRCRWTSALASTRTGASSTASAESPAARNSGRCAAVGNCTLLRRTWPSGLCASRSSSRSGTMRFILEPNDVQPISFDIVLSGVTPPFFEERNLVRNRRTGRIDVDVIRYHQGGWASGTVTVDGRARGHTR